ncbi:hypothetical protein SAMN02745117_02240 [Lampropedia hyalina DSM 16112]|uniref:Uncharacterized protein n=1 Tax=Lampropedia hyalina DSM 16112 TaxID=1122156 RepID=A0A1M5CUD5_9BURK|nr:hypothetical protein SAMN02745117_02240 [Lampropedia hyalina DSM 16112]
MIVVVVSHQHSLQRQILLLQRMQNRPGFTRINDQCILPIVQKPDVVIMECSNGLNLEFGIHDLCDYKFG